MGVIVTDVQLSKNPVKVQEEFKIFVAVRETLDEPKMYRLSFRLGQPKGNVGGIKPP